MSSKKVVIYCRYSSDMQRPASCADQERVVRAGLARLGLLAGTRRGEHLFATDPGTGPRRELPAAGRLLPRLDRAAGRGARGGPSIEHAQSGGDGCRARLRLGRPS